MFQRKNLSSSQMVNPAQQSLHASLSVHAPTLKQSQTINHFVSFWKLFGLFMLMSMIAIYIRMLHLTPTLPTQQSERELLRSTAMENIVITTKDVAEISVNSNSIHTGSSRMMDLRVVVVNHGNGISGRNFITANADLTRASPDKETKKIVVTSTDAPVVVEITPVVPDDAPTNIDPPKAVSGQQNNDTEPWHIIIAHTPRFDLLGSFVLPTVFLYAVTNYHNYTLQILPFAGSRQQAKLTKLVGLKGNLSEAWGSGFQDASHRTDYDPVVLNEMSYQTMGFFPDLPKDSTIHTKHPWIFRGRIPSPGKELNEVCKETYNLTTGSGDGKGQMKKECYLLLSNNPFSIREYMDHLLGSVDPFFTPIFCQKLRSEFLLKNHHRLQQYNIPNPTVDIEVKANRKNFNVAVHIRRGDILHPERWIDQQVFANVAKHICQENHDRDESLRTNIHVFSSGPNRDGNWSIMESLGQPSTDISIGGINQTSMIAISKPPICANVIIHLDEIEFDSWTFMIAADALVISTSTFSYIPALIRYENVYYPKKFWHPALSSFIIFDDTSGKILPSKIKPL